MTYRCGIKGRVGNCNHVPLPFFIQFWSLLVQFVVYAIVVDMLHRGIDNPIGFLSSECPLYHSNSINRLTSFEKMTGETKVKN